MSDDSFSEELEEGNIFQLARVTSARKRRRIQTNDTNQANALESPHVNLELANAATSSEDPSKRGYPLLHTISLSPSKTSQTPALTFDIPSSPIKSAPIGEPAPPTKNNFNSDYNIQKFVDDLHNLPDKLSGIVTESNNINDRLRYDHKQPTPILRNEYNEPELGALTDEFNEPLDTEEKETETETEQDPVNTGNSVDVEDEAGKDASIIPSDFSLSSSMEENVQHPEYILPSLSPPLGTITTVENHSIRDLVAAMPFVEIPFTEMPEPLIQIQQPLTKAHTIRLQIIKSTIGKLQKRMARDIISIDSLQETNISLPTSEDFSENLVRQLWTTGSQVGRLAQLNITVRHLKQTRTELMNQISEYRSTTGLNRASAQAYAQFKSQVEEARSTLLELPKSGHTLTSIKQAVEELRSKLAATTHQCTAREEEYRLSSQNQVARIKAGIASPSTTNMPSLSAIEHTIRQLGANLGARVSFNGPTEMVVVLRYLNIVVDVAASASPTYIFSYPKVLLPVFRHYERLVMKSVNLVEACRLWNRCLTIRAELSVLLAKGPYQFEEVEGLDNPTLLFSLQDLQARRRVDLKLSGAKVLIDEPVSELLAPLKKLADFELTTTNR